MKRILTWFAADAQRAVYVTEALAVVAVIIIIAMENLS